MGNSAAALDVVAAQIAGLDAELVRIEEQTMALVARRQGIEMMKRALTPLLVANAAASDMTITPLTGTAHFSTTHDSFGGSATTVMVARATSRSGASAELTTNPSSTGFRDALRKVLRDCPKGLRPAEVLAELARRGELSKYKGKTDPAVRVHNELYSLRKSGALSRRAGRYSLVVQTDALT